MSIYKYIAIEGNIGAGKTTLAKFLATAFKGDLLLEEFQENKFLQCFYQTGNFAFQSEIQFLLDRSKQLKEYFDLKHDFVIADYFPSKSLIFSKMNLEHKEYSIISELHQHLFFLAPKPELLIFLDRNIDSLFFNIKKRNRSYEQQMDLEYLSKLSRAYENWLMTLDIPIIRIDADTINLNHPDIIEKNFQQLFTSNFPKTQRKVKLMV